MGANCSRHRMPTRSPKPGAGNNSPTIKANGIGLLNISCRKCPRWRLLETCFFTGNLQGPRKNGSNRHGRRAVAQKRVSRPPRRAGDAQEAATTRKISARHEKPAGPLGILPPALALPARPAGDERCRSPRMLRFKRK